MGNSNDFSILMVSVNGTRWMANHLLQAVLEKNGFNVKTVYFRENYQDGTPIQDEERARFLDVVRELKPDMAGFSVTSFSLNIASELTNLIKNELGIPVIWGGIHPSLEPVDTMKRTDIACIGEGEEAIVEVAESIRDGKLRTDIPNIWCKENGNIIANNTRPLFQDLDSLPYGNYNNKNKYFIIANKLYKEYNPSLYYLYEYSILTCRGCPYMCTFCASHTTSKLATGTFLRRRSVDNVIGELKLATEKYPRLKMIYIWDDIFTFDKKWLKQFADVYIKEIHKPFFCYVHPKMIDDERMLILKEMGVSEVAMGFQHGSERIRRDYFERHETNDDILTATRLFKKYNITPNLDTITTPFDTEQDNYDNMDLLLQVPKPFRLAMHSLTFFPKYKITERALAENVIDVDRIVGEKNPEEVAITKKEMNENPWICYQALVGKKYIPNFLLRIMIKTKMHERCFIIIRLSANIVVMSERLYNSFRRNFMLLRDGEFKHLIGMTAYIKNFFKYNR